MKINEKNNFLKSRYFHCTDRNQTRTRALAVSARTHHIGAECRGGARLPSVGQLGAEAGGGRRSGVRSEGGAGRGAAELLGARSQEEAGAEGGVQSQRRVGLEQEALRVRHDFYAREKSRRSAGRRREERAERSGSSRSIAGGSRRHFVRSGSAHPICAEPADRLSGEEAQLHLRTLTPPPARSLLSPQPARTLRAGGTNATLQNKSTGIIRLHVPHTCRVSDCLCTKHVIKVRRGPTCSL